MIEQPQIIEIGNLVYYNTTQNHFIKCEVTNIYFKNEDAVLVLRVISKYSRDHQYGTIIHSYKKNVMHVDHIIKQKYEIKIPVSQIAVL